MFSLFSEYIHLSVLQAILVHRSLHVLHVLLEHVCGVEKKFDVRYLLSTISICGFFFFGFPFFSIVLLLDIRTFDTKHWL